MGILFCTLGKHLQLRWSSVLCSCACVLCSPRKLNWFLNLNSGIFLRDEGIFKLLLIDFCEASQVNWEIFSYQMGQVVSFNWYLHEGFFHCQVIGSILLSLSLLEVHKCFTGFDIAGGEWLFVIQKKTCGFIWQWLSNVIEMAFQSHIPRILKIIHLNCV